MELLRQWLTLTHDYATKTVSVHLSCSNIGYYHPWWRWQPSFIMVTVRSCNMSWDFTPGVLPTFCSWCRSCDIKHGRVHYIAQVFSKVDVLAACWIVQSWYPNVVTVFCHAASSMKGVLIESTSIDKNKFHPGSKADTSKQHSLREVARQILLHMPSAYSFYTRGQQYVDQDLPIDCKNRFNRPWALFTEEKNVSRKL